eukprot:TRINITY_DN8635_c0_g1_i3.p1 TRINITY_DN8635_c0_g1~~TRINITY_DN8635_c0_g1_i3.p1  ORF type:complete len:564 (-),score=62.18 TRINITY_DN8635_c0_g1_i3:280-1875(-)
MPQRRSSGFPRLVAIALFAVRDTGGAVPVDSLATAVCSADLRDRTSCSNPSVSDAIDALASQTEGGLVQKPAPRLASEHLLLQRASVSASRGPDLVRDESGFEGDDEIDEVKDTTCVEASVRRRRQEGSNMCACRRRSSGKRYDGGWLCQNDRMVQETPRWTNPVWSDEFDGDLVNESRWTLIDSGSGNGNKEKQWYTTRPENARVENGVLTIVGKRESYRHKHFTSAKLLTKGKGDWGPGHRIEVRARLPLGGGTWPAIWMMPTDYNYGGWPDSGEIDIMEALGRSHGKVFGTIHTGAYNHMKGTHKGKSFYTDFSEWHTYALDWEEDKLSWYADGNLYNTFAPDDTNNYAKWPFNRRFYLILNLALGGTLGGSTTFSSDQVMEIDYVRVYCLDGSTTCQTPKITCCGKCSGQPFCSPKSGRCYDSKRSDYYDTCDIQPNDPGDASGGNSTLPVSPSVPACCGKCAGKPFCSPNSENCYEWKRKDYYESCGGKASCCAGCAGKPFCSTVSQRCYDSKRRDHYASCTSEDP